MRSTPSLFKKLPYDPMRDFAPVAFVGYTPTLLVVAADSPVKSLKDLAALAARPEGVTFASAGNGTSGHLAGELLAQRLGGKMIHVPYKEGAVAMTDVMAGQVDFMFYHPAAVDAADQGRQAARARRQRRGAQRRRARRADADGAGRQATSTWSPGSCSTRPRPRRRRCLPQLRDASAPGAGRSPS